MTRPAVHLPDHLRREVIDHCVSELPNEGCGLFAMSGDQVVKVYPTANLAKSPIGYRVPPEAHIAALADAEASGWVLGGVFHSHPMGRATLSMTDVQTAMEPAWLYLVLGLRGEPELRGWSVRDGAIDEVGITHTGPEE